MQDVVGCETAIGARIKVVGVGGAGGNAVNTMIASELQGVELYALNTDVQALAANLAPNKLQLGQQITRGLGAGGNPEIGRRAAEDDIDRIREVLSGADMVFVTAGMGGGTGTGAAPVIARVAKEMGALTVAVVTKPFAFEAKQRMRQAEEGIRLLKEAVDTLLVIPNQRLLAVLPADTRLTEAFRKCDEVLVHAVRGIADLITVHGLINLDFADVCTIMRDSGLALMGWGEAVGPDRAMQAAQQAVANPLLEDVSIDGARRVLVNITLSPDLNLHEIDTAVNYVRDQAHPDVNLIFGVVLDETAQDRFRLTLVATGFADQAAEPVLTSERQEPVGQKALPLRDSEAVRQGPAISSEPPAAPARPAASLRRRIFRGTIVDDASEPHVLSPGPSVLGSNATSSQAPEPPYRLDSTEEDLEMPAFLRRRVS